MVRGWRRQHAVPLRAKQVAWLSMAISSGVGWVPAACCALVALWMWRLPTADRR